MRRCAGFVSALTAGLVVIACSDHAVPSPAALRLSAAKTGSVTCSFAATNPLVSHYFNGIADKQLVTSLINDMQTAFNANDTTGTRDRGFDAMTHIASQVKAQNADYQDAAALTNALLGCMLFSPAELPLSFPGDFTIATNPAADGAYEVRGEPPTDPDADPGQRVYGRPTSFDASGFPTAEGFSGLVPQPPFAWSQVIHTTRGPTRVLLYGQPGPNPHSYDWRAVPRTVSYATPGGELGALVGLCVADTRTLVHESGSTFTGFNPFVDAFFVDPSICRAVALERSRWSPGRLLSSLFRVRPLWGNPGGLGGTIGGHSEFNADVATMTTSFAQQPPDRVSVCAPVEGVPNAGCPASALFTVAVATSGSGTRADGTVDTGPIGIATVHLAAVTNNGTYGQLCELVPPENITFVCEAIGDSTGAALTQVSGSPPGFAPATFANLFFTKTGAERLIANGGIGGRAITGQATSNKLNVNP